MDEENALSGFAPGEAERLATELRARVRKGDKVGADRIFLGLLNRLTTRLERAARNAFGARPDLIEDAVQQAAVALYEKLIDLREIPNIKHWEIRFHQALTTLLSDAFRKIRTTHRTVSEQTDGASDEGDDRAPSPLERLTASDDPLATVLSQSLRDAIPDKLYRALALDLAGYTRAESAARLGCSEKTFYNRSQKARAIVLASLNDTRR